MIFDNLAALPLSGFRLTARSSVAELPAGRRDQLGSDSWIQQVVISWHLEADPSPAIHTVWMTFVPGSDSALLAGTTDAPQRATHTEPLPLWWLVPISMQQAGDVTALVESSSDLGEQWARAANDAVMKIRPHIRGVDSRRPEHVVVQVPATTLIFEQLLGARRGSYDEIAGVTWADGSPARAPLRIVINPASAGKLSDLGIHLLLAHEATHVATHSIDSPAPAWAVEGFADYVAYQAYPEAGEAAAAPLLARVRDGNGPADLPSEERFRSGTDRIDLAYAEAWLACRYVSERFSPEGLTELYKQLDGGESLDRAARSVLGISAAEFTSGWRDYLSALAR